MPKEVGVLLLAAGMIMGVLPPPPGPFDLSVMLAGGVALWPRGLRATELSMRRHFPGAHRVGMNFLDRYLDDLERRYPGATNAVDYERAVLVRILGDLARADPRGAHCETPRVDAVADTAARPDQGPASDVPGRNSARPRRVDATAWPASAGHGKGADER